ncbi:MAG: aminotransferase class IV [Ectothiorhodospiraceae bacterium]|nr:aminotransferase class IV [Chromatiales bacterium]MCP5154221.1 aminotransferase class IV [Ectothiorhodospiraceae bacterium]
MLADGAAWVDGRIVPIAEASIPVTDWGFTRSDVTYDVVHVWHGRFFRLEDHLDRFERSCRALRLDPGLDRDAMREVLMTCVRRSGLREAYVEMLCTRGVPRPGSRDPRLAKNRFMAFAIPFVWVLSPEIQARGGHLTISDVPRIPPQSVDPTVKNFHWGDLTRGLFQAYERGADTAVLVDMEGFVSEGPGFNVFCVRDGRVVSPGGTVLEGITRATVRELCELVGIPFSLGRVTPDELRDADEVFLSSTAGGIMPISRVDDRVLSNGRPGAVTTRLRDLYWVKHDEGWHGTDVDY